MKETLLRMWEDRSRRANITRTVDCVKYLAVIAAVILLMERGTERLGYNWQWYRIPRYLFSLEGGHFSAGPLLSGLVVTLKITAAGMAFAFSIGLVTAFMRLSNSFMARAVARVYLEVVRNTPLLVQLFFIYFVLAPVLGFSRFFAAVLALSLFEGAYASEIFRAGILSIPRGQWEGAYSVGLTTARAYRHVILPQAIRHVLPPLTGQAVSLIKDSALVSTIAVYDLTMQGQAIIAETYLVFEVWFLVAAIYLAVTLSLSMVVYRMERKLKEKY